MSAILDEETEDDDLLASFLESEILSTSSEKQQQQEEESENVEPDLPEEEQQGVLAGGSTSQNQHHQHHPMKRKEKIKKKRRLEPEDVDDTDEASRFSGRSGKAPRLPHPGQIDIGVFSRIPSELFHHILKFLSSEDLISCSLVCRFMNFAASDESLWRRLYCLRWGLSSPAGKLHTCPWKRLYIQRDEEDMVEFIKNTPFEFREYYIQMQAAKRSLAPLLSQVNDDHMILDKTVADQVSLWKKKRGLTDDAVLGHVCSGNTCTYSQIGDVFLCEKTGRVHVCDDTCREVVLDPSSGILVCTISGHCFDRLLSPEEELDVVMLNSSFQEQQGIATDEAEPFMGSGRFARAYLLGYSCADEKELEAALRFC